MCIIAAKPANTKMPDMDTLENMWYGNPDGAGIMYAKDGKVRIEKGLMTFADFTAKLDEIAEKVDLVKAPVVMHFRITTHGGTCPANTHPFPVTDSVQLLQRTSVATHVGVAHNGIIPITPRKGISDTMEYIATQLAPLSRALPDWYTNADALTLVKNGIQSKMAVLTGAGELVTIGAFTEDNGIKYSNTSYKGWGRGGRFSLYDCRDDYYGYYDSEGTSKKSGKKSKSKGKAKTEAKKTEPETSTALTSISVRKKALMWLCAKYPDAFIYTETGNLIEGEEFLIDRDNKLYVYDVNGDYAIKREHYRAYSATGTAVRYDDKYASLEYVLDSYFDEVEEDDGAPWA